MSLKLEALTKPTNELIISTLSADPSVRNLLLPLAPQAAVTGPSVAQGARDGDETLRNALRGSVATRPAKLARKITTAVAVTGDLRIPFDIAVQYSTVSKIMVGSKNTWFCVLLYLIVLLRTLSYGASISANAIADLGTQDVNKLYHSDATDGVPRKMLDLVPNDNHETEYLFTSASI
ncbi:Hypothetical protein CINCED_3A022793 [Cinara cedri]|uniref:Uncharacterized protein n=1 Tax=Cinara cedri TaxID=506608 RepID=A0A5E4MGJ7_9HEMI|nr:Hypothetical protein CINCED_3A022793 [Cinara cedri]